MARKPAPAAEETSVYEQLLETATGIDEDFKPKGKKEDDQAYMQRLIDYIDNIEPDAWEAMSAEAQAWFNDAVAQTKEEETIDYPDGYEPVEEEATPPASTKASKKPAEQLAEQVTKRQSSKAAKTAAADDEEEAAPPKKAGAKAGAAKPAAKAAKPPNGAAKPMGAVALIQQYMVKNPSHNADQVAKYLAKQGREDVQASTITVTRGGVLSVLRFAKEAGLLAE